MLQDFRLEESFWAHISLACLQNLAARMQLIHGARHDSFQGTDIRDERRAGTSHVKVSKFLPTAARMSTGSEGSVPG